MKFLRTISIVLIIGIPLFAYVPRRSLMPAGMTLVRWNESSFPITWRLNPTPGSNVAVSRDVAAVLRQAFQAWASVATAAMSFAEGATISTANAGQDAINLISLSPASYSADAPSLTVLYTITNPSPGQFPGQIIEADILFNPQALLSTDLVVPADHYDLQSLAVHEIGHLLGLDHSGLASAAMYFVHAKGSTTGRALASDDLLGISNLYPAPDFFATRGSLHGMVRRPAGTAVFGAHVVISDSSGQPVVSTLTEPDGSYLARGLAPGSYSVYAEPLDGPLTITGIETLGTAYPNQTPATDFTTRFAGAATAVPALTLTKTSGDNQTGTAGHTAAQPMEVTVSDGNGVPVQGAIVRFAAASSAGSVAPIQAVTDAQGKTRTTAYLGKGSIQTFLATIGSSSVTFTVTAPIASILILDSSSTSSIKEIIVNEGNTLQARVGVYDVNGTARSDVPVTYSSINSEVATVDSGGNIQAKKAGFSTLTVTAGGIVGVATISVVGVTAGAAAPETTGIAQDLARRLYLASKQDHTIQLVQALGQAPQPYAGLSQTPGLINGSRSEARFNGPAFIAVDQTSGALYVSDSANNVIRRVEAGTNGRVETFAGTSSPGSQNGPATTATFNNPQGIALDGVGNLWVADAGNHLIRRINLATRTVETIAGFAGAAGTTDGAGTNARFNAPVGIALEPETLPQQLERFRVGGGPPLVSMIIADTGNGRIRRVKENGIVETLGTAASALTMDTAKVFAVMPVETPFIFASPTGIAVDPAGNVYLTEPGSGEVRVILRSGSVVRAAQPNTFRTPRGLAITENGKVIVADQNRSALEVRYGEPQITSITPDRVSYVGGTKIVIRGKNFAPDSLIAIGPSVISSVIAAESNTDTISFTVPSLPSGRTTVTVQTRGGIAQVPLQVDPLPFSQLPAGHITTYAGGSTFVGDGAAGTIAALKPSSIALDSNGNVFIADSANNKIRRVDSRTGVITTVAGNGVAQFAGDGGPAIVAALNGPTGVALDLAGNLYVAEFNGQRIRRIDARTGIVTTVAGKGSGGYSGDGGPALQAGMNPAGIVIDTAGNIYLSDYFANRVRRVDAQSGLITTVAGDGQERLFGDGGPGTAASLNRPESLAFDAAGNLFIADTANNRIRKLASNGTITTAVGSEAGFSTEDGTPALTYKMGHPSGLAVDVEGNIFFSDNYPGRIRKVSASDNRVTTVVGNGKPDTLGDGGPAVDAGPIFFPGALAIGAAGNLFIAQNNNPRVRKVDGRTGVISTIAGVGEETLLGDNGQATSATLKSPRAIAFDSAGNLYFADGKLYFSRIRKIDVATGTITTVVGTGLPAGGLGDGGPATAAELFEPAGLAFDTAGNLYISDHYDRIRKVDAQTKVISTFAGGGNPTDGVGDGGPATAAKLRFPQGIAVIAGHLYIIDYENFRIRRVNLSTGIISTFAGNGTDGYSGDGGAATSASISKIWSMASDSAGNVFLADYSNQIIRRIDASSQIITTAAGGGSNSIEMNNISATAARILPTAVAADSSSRVLYTDQYRNGVFRGALNDQLARVGGGTYNSGFAGDNGPASAAQFRFGFPGSMGFDQFGNLFIADTDNNRIRAIRAPIP